MWTFILLIVVASLTYQLIRQRNLARSGHVEDGSGNLHKVAEREAELQREVEELRERIQVLERIATADRETRQLAEDIEKLRDEQEVRK